MSHRIALLAILAFGAGVAQAFPNVRDESNHAADVVSLTPRSSPKTIQAPTKIPFDFELGVSGLKKPPTSEVPARPCNEKTVPIGWERG
jgi:hypothetical protein